jgi:hypothetical protein
MPFLVTTLWNCPGQDGERHASRSCATQRPITLPAQLRLQIQKIWPEHLLISACYCWLQNFFWNVVLFSKEISFSTGSNGVNFENKRCTKIAQKLYKNWIYIYLCLYIDVLINPDNFRVAWLRHQTTCLIKLFIGWENLTTSYWFLPFSPFFK